MICIPITCQTAEQAHDAIQRAAAIAEIVELRLDFLNSPSDAQAIIDQCPLPLIATYRLEVDGGQRDIAEAQRLALLTQCATWGAQYIDIEIDHTDKLTLPTQCKRIVSYHCFENCPDNLAQIAKSIDEHPSTDIGKFAVMATKIEDNLVAAKLIQQATKPTIGLCMGELGIISRILANRFNSFLTFASLEKGSESAPGQITASELKDKYNFDSQNPQTTVYGIIANPVGHSLSPDIHNAAFKSLGINSVYVPFKVEHDPVAFIKVFDQLPVLGYSVTIPHKEAVQGALATIEPLSEKIGALNTIVREDDASHFGCNTDCEAAINALLAITSLKDKRVYLLGAGGAAKALGYGAINEGASLTIVNRTLERAQALAKQLDANGKVTAISPNDLSQQAGGIADIIINTTPIGMWPKTQDSPLPSDLLHKNMVVFDTIYNPQETRLLGDAKALGCKTLNGIDMFIGQAARQFERWTKQKAPTDVMRRVMLERLAKQATR